ncbi:MAG TPA: FGGY-family carbohydrate kinase [Candidatus Anaerotruncus excrementipullorum]|uniref:FGGY-family carbohydrate kinase n=1 Tax=Candidatus Anaerotruncus excrementipullorum TaxID=2838465 RepID=A0A9D1WR35_9FIRM|nr:FGGY-family carbohydrate kinase [Candidatus Anaerotruncus excrementipullorum]
MDSLQIKTAIQAGQTFLGVELGSTRIKAVLIGPDHTPIASGGYQWENRWENGVWTYPLQEVWEGLQASWKELADQVQAAYGLPLTRLGGLGFSAMMHGYLAFDQAGELLVPFRTWRNTITGQAAEELTQLFRFNIPQRWSVAHLWQAALNGEEHLARLDFVTTLAGYVHWQLTGQKVVGVGEASGMFPIDSAACDYDGKMVEQFQALAAGHGYRWELKKLFPRVLAAGQPAGNLTPQGARLLDPSGRLEPGAPLCPPEGDAGTGMVATNSIAPRTGNVSAGTSVFAMAVLENPLSQVHPEIDLVTTPAGLPVAMVHCNNCTSDLNAWVGLFGQVVEALGLSASQQQLYETLFTQALAGEKDGGGLLSYNYDSGEPVSGFTEGRPLFLRSPDSRFNLPNFMRTLLYSAVATLRLGMRILEEEGVHLDRLLGHGGYFKTPGVGQKLMAAALHVPVAVMETAGEGGAWGIALLAAYLVQKQEGQSLEDYLNTRVFAGNRGWVVEPDPADQAGFDAFLNRYAAGLAIQQAAVEHYQ